MKQLTLITEWTTAPSHGGGTRKALRVGMEHALATTTHASMQPASEILAGHLVLAVVTCADEVAVAIQADPNCVIIDEVAA